MPEFIVKTGKFEGPIDLLLEMIEARKLPINDVALAEVADDFINHLKDGRVFPLDTAANFVVIASTLLLIKSMSLLPGFELKAEEEENINDLKRRLAVYQVIREVASQIKENYGRRVIFFREAPSENKVIVFSPADDLTLDNLTESLRSLISDLPKHETKPQVSVRKVISLEEMIENLTRRIQKNMQLKFSELSGGEKEQKITVIVSFLALLELIKRGLAVARQQSHFSDIEIKRFEHERA